MGRITMTDQTNRQPVLSIDHLWVEYVDSTRKTPAVRDFSLQIYEGEVYGLVGELGCGKSTAALACVRYLPAGTKTRGKIELLGENIFDMSERQLRQIRGDRVAMVYQDPLSSLNPSMTIMSQMEEILTVHEQISSQAARRRCLEVLDLVRIADPQDVAGRYPHQLSGGMQQRVIIAMALLLKPSLLIMDEPTTGLDVTIEAAVLDLVNDLRSQFNTAILFISHNLGVIARICENVSVMYAGEMVEEAQVIDLFKSPKHPYTNGLLRCIPRKGTSKTTRPLWSIAGRVPALNDLPNHCIFAARCAMAQDRCLQSPIQLTNISDARRVRCLRWNEVSEERLQAEDEIPPRIDLAQKSQEPSTGLEVKDLKVQFVVSQGILSLNLKKDTVKAVDGVSFTLPAHKTVGIVGESGCGKSTLARAIAGLVPISDGDAKLAGNDLNRPVNQRKKDTLQMLQMVFQNPESTLNPQKTVEEELRRPLRLFQKVSRQEEGRLVGQLLEAVNLDDSYRERYPPQLSGGEKQRVAIARAFAGSPQIVLCDEPTSSLDVSVQSMVLNMLQRLQQDFGVSLLFISHDLGVVRYISDYIGVIYLGRLCEFGAVEQVFQPPYHPYTEALLSAIPVPDPTVRRDRIHLEGNVPSSINPPKGCGFHTRCPRKLGAICEETNPPMRQMDEHRIYCHIPREELQALQKDVS